MSTPPFLFHCVNLKERSRTFKQQLPRGIHKLTHTPATSPPVYEKCILIYLYPHARLRIKVHVGFSISTVLLSWCACVWCGLGWSCWVLPVASTGSWCIPDGRRMARLAGNGPPHLPLWFLSDFSNPSFGGLLKATVFCLSNEGKGEIMVTYDLMCLVQSTKGLPLSLRHKQKKKRPLRARSSYALAKRHCKVVLLTWSNLTRSRGFKIGEKAGEGLRWRRTEQGFNFPTRQGHSETQ